MPSCACRFAALLALSVLLGRRPCHAQEIEPRAYSPSPSGVNFLLAVAGHSEGGVLTDPSLPVTDIEAKIGALAFGYGRTFGIAGRSANFGTGRALLCSSTPPATSARTARSVSREGIGDTKLRLAVNLIGGRR